MPKWLPLPSEKLFYQPDQAAFLLAHKQRKCQTCKLVYEAPPTAVCPVCNIRGSRLFDRLTIIAGRRWGKSRVGSIASVEEATIPNTIGWACAPTNPKLHRYVIPAFQQLIPPDWVASWSSEFLDLRLKNGSLIHFQTLEDPDQGRGQGLDWVWIDEVCELTRKHWDVLSPSLADKQGVAFFTTSPRSYDWVYEDLYRPAEDNVPGYWACHAMTRDNPIMSEAYLAREKIRLSPAMYSQEYEADFVIFTGAVYGASIEPQTLRTDLQIQSIIPEWPAIAPWRQVLVGLDSGADHPFGAIKLISTEKGMVVVGEYLERDRTWAQHATAIKALAGSGNTKYAINRNERQGMIELGQHGIYCQPAENDVVSGTERVKTWLQQEQLWFIADRCPRALKELKAYRWAENTSPKTGEARKEKVFKVNDELPDCLRYALMTWPTLPVPKAADTSRRDISQLPAEMRSAIERMRKLDPEPKEEKLSAAQEFWS